MSREREQCDIVEFFPYDEGFICCTEDLGHEGSHKHQGRKMNEKHLGRAPEDVDDLKEENEKLVAKLELAKSGIQHIKKNALWGVEVNCDSLIALLEKE
jgi:hypothetical protein